MIKAYFTGKQNVAREFESCEALTKHLEGIPQGTPCEVIVRLPDDATLFELGAWRSQQEQAAVKRINSVVMPGASASLWQQSFMSVDGDGWRIIFTFATLSQQPGARR